MDINNNQQTNTFIKGMDTDTSDMYIGEGSYRYAENLRVVTNKDSNSGELHIIEGTEKISGHTATITVDDDHDTTPSDQQLLGFTSIRDYMIEIVKHGGSEESWSIVRVDKQGNRTLIAGPFNKQIWPNGWDGKTKPLSLVTRWEADDNIKLYIANGITELLVINIAETNQGSDFDTVFQSTKTILFPPQVSVTEQIGATIPGVTLQYAYVIYKKRGQASSVSLLSKVVTIPKDATHGYESEQYTAKIVNVTLPTDVVGKYVKLYRIAYSKAGQLPQVDVIYNQKCENRIIVDSGQSLENVSSSEFIATNKLLFVPKEIESKGDYLFAGNVEYTQDKIDEQFINFDARCFSKGSYYLNNGQTIDIFGDRTGQDLDDFINSIDKDVDLHNHQFDPTNVETYNLDYWRSITKTVGTYANAKINGYGKCFAWRYTYDYGGLYFDKQYNSSQSKRTYGRNEVYRFGVRLFDAKGNASSVKWIADIKMPDYFGDPDDGDVTIKNYVEHDNNLQRRHGYISTNLINIQFIPINTDSDLWNGVSKYEIVQAKRSISDSYKIAQGICGFPQGITSNDGNNLIRDYELCMPYFLTTSPIVIRRGVARSNSSGDQLYTYLSVSDYYSVLDFIQYKKALIFASPEYTYQPDDIQAILKNYKDNISCKEVCTFTRDALVKNGRENNGNNNVFNFAESDGASYVWTASNPLKLLQYFTNSDSSIINNTYKNNLTIKGADLLVQFSPSQEKYYLTAQTMAFSIDHSAAQWNPIGGVRNSAIKSAYFTTMYTPNVCGNVTYINKKINGLTFVKEADPEDFAKNEWPTYKTKFNTLNNGKRFFNWTNPVLLSPDVYAKFTAGGDDTTDSFLRTTMTSYDSPKIAWKQIDSFQKPSDETYDFVRGILGSYGLTFPTSPGGPSIILEFNNDVQVPQYITQSPLYDTPGLTGATGVMPQIPVCNICKPATPYGGDNVSSRNNTQYTSFGMVGDKDTAVTMNCGDNYITMFVYMPYHCFDNAVHDAVPTAAIQYIVPIESTIDLSRQCSDYIQATNQDSLPIGKYGKGAWVQVHPSTVAGRLTQTQDMYMYNTAYSVLPDIVTYSAEDTVNAASALYDSRIHYSQKKQNNELIDNWSNFKAVDYLDVDSRYGQITGLKLFKDKLIFLQENGAGVLSVNDRILLNDQTSANIIVGNGGVLDRYDYFTTMYGMKPEQHVIESSNDALYWWDGHRREIISYVDGYNVALLQRLKNVSNYINSRVDSDTPSIVYDTNNKEVLFNVVKPDSSSNGETLVYNEQIQQFTSVYTFSPIYYCNINGEIFLTDNWENGPKLYKYNKQSVAGPLLFGELAYSEWDEDEPAGSNEHEMDDEEEYGQEFGDELPIELRASNGPRRSSRPSEEIWSNKALPKLKYVVNKDSTYNKVFDIQTFGGRFYEGDVSHLSMSYSTPLMQTSSTTGNSVTKIEYDYRLAVPRNNNDAYGGRMRGKTMECEITSDSNSYDFSIQYVTTKYRMSWT